MVKELLLQIKDLQALRGSTASVVNALLINYTHPMVFTSFM